MSIWTSPHGRPLPDYTRRTLIMGILNVTPDSFSDGGRFATVDRALRQAEKLLDEGADLLDLGAESTRPGAAVVEVEEEMERLIPVIRAIRERFPEVALSADTYKAEVAEGAIEAGADIINDVWGLTHEVKDPAQDPSPMAEVVAKGKGPVILMHNRREARYEKFWPEFLADLDRSLDLAARAGIEPENIVLDPGFGFGKTAAHNLEVLRGLERLVEKGFPVLLGTSRKSTIGKVLDRPDPLDRMEGNIATNLWGIAKGVRIIRVHDVAPFPPLLRMTDAIAQGMTYREPQKP